jgi:hypothetical protein
MTEQNRFGSAIELKTLKAWNIYLIERSESAWVEFLETFISEFHTYGFEQMSKIQDISAREIFENFVTKVSTIISTEKEHSAPIYECLATRSGFYSLIVMEILSFTPSNFVNVNGLSVAILTALYKLMNISSNYLIKLEQENKLKMKFHLVSRDDQKD